jgi:hypothetical protein
MKNFLKAFLILILITFSIHSKAESSRSNHDILFIFDASGSMAKSMEGKQMID